jgi:hypothetical protein
MKRAAVVAAVIVGLVIATWHVTVAVKALFVFRENEPLTSWLALFLGPGLTVLGCLLAFVRPFAGGATVLAGGLLGAAAFLIGEGGRTEYIRSYFLQFTAPMLAIGIALIALSVLRTHQDVGNAT